MEQGLSQEDAAVKTDQLIRTSMARKNDVPKYQQAVQALLANRQQVVAVIHQLNNAVVQRQQKHQAAYQQFIQVSLFFACSVIPFRPTNASHIL